MMLGFLQRLWRTLLGGEQGPLQRMLVLVKPKQPYVQWVRQHSGNPDYTLAESLRSDSMAFLIPTVNWDREEADDYIEHNRNYFFAQMLLIWEHDEVTWPPEPTQTMFRHWFEVEVCDMVYDLARLKG